MSYIWRYTEEDFKRIMNTPVKIQIGRTMNDEESEHLEGEIYSLRLADNPPFLPMMIYFRTKEGDRQFPVLSIQWLELII